MCQRCGKAEGKYIFKELEVCSDCVTAMAQQEPGYFADQPHEISWRETCEEMGIQLEANRVSNSGGNLQGIQDQSEQLGESVGATSQSVSV